MQAFTLHVYPIFLKCISTLATIGRDFCVCNAMQWKAKLFFFIRNFPPRLWVNDIRYTWKRRYKLNSWMNDSLLKKTRCVWMHKQNERQKKNTKLTHALNEQELNDSSAQNPYTLFFYSKNERPIKEFYRFQLIKLARFKFIFNFSQIFLNISISLFRTFHICTNTV